MKGKRLIEVVLAISCLLSLTSCFDEDLFDKDKMSRKISWNSDYTLPAAFLDYKFEDIIDVDVLDGLLASKPEYVVLNNRSIGFSDTLMNIDISNRVTKKIDSLAMNMYFSKGNLHMDIDIKEIKFYNSGNQIVASSIYEGDIRKESDGDEIRFVVPFPSSTKNVLYKIKHVGIEAELNSTKMGTKIPLDATIGLNITFRVMVDHNIKFDPNDFSIKY